MIQPLPEIMLASSETHYINKNFDTLKPTKIYLFEFLKE